jgi:hypothetical protein
MRRVGELEVLATMATGIAKNPLVAPIRRAGSAIDDTLCRSVFGRDRSVIDGTFSQR